MSPDGAGSSPEGAGAPPEGFTPPEGGAAGGRIIATGTPEQIAANPALADLEGRAIKSAGIVLCTLPIMCFYPFLQKFFVTGIVVGSVKG